MYLADKLKEKKGVGDLKKKTQKMNSPFSLPKKSTGVHEVENKNSCIQH